MIVETWEWSPSYVCMRGLWDGLLQLSWSCAVRGVQNQLPNIILQLEQTRATTPGDDPGPRACEIGVSSHRARRRSRSNGIGKTKLLYSSSQVTNEVFS